MGSRLIKLVKDFVLFRLFVIFLRMRSGLFGVEVCVQRCSSQMLGSASPRRGIDRYASVPLNSGCQ